MMRNFSVVVFSWQLSRIFFLSDLTCSKIFLFIYYILTLIKHGTAQLYICLCFVFPRGVSPSLQFHNCLQNFYMFSLWISFLALIFITSNCSFSLLNKLWKFLGAIIGPLEKYKIHDWWIFSIMKHNKAFTAFYY